MALGKDDLVRAFGAEFVEGLGCADWARQFGKKDRLANKVAKGPFVQAAFFLLPRQN